MLLLWLDLAHTTQMDADIVYYVAGFTCKSIKHAVIVLRMVIFLKKLCFINQY